MKTPFWDCFWYLIFTGIIGFLAGRLAPKAWFQAEAFPYRPFAWEENGKLYEKMNIRRWQNKVPDMSKILPAWMPAKSLGGDYKNRLPQMLQETCVAEMTHALLCVSGLYCLKLWPGPGGLGIYALYVVIFNLPYILIQRYNRPRLQRLAQKLNRMPAAKRRRSLA